LKVVLNDTQEVVILTMTPELGAELNDWRDEKCTDHPEVEWRQFPTSNGGVQIRRQCMICGHILGNSRKRMPGDDNLPLIDRKSPELYDAQRKNKYDAIIQRHAHRQRDKDNSWFHEHTAYLSSDAWKEKRRLIFRRSAGICEGCGVREAAEVHHLSYTHWQSEFLFELVAVCKECHERLHEPQMEQTDDYDDDEPPYCDCRWADRGQDGNPWCSLLEQPISQAMAEDGECGPKRKLVDGLR
jgi:hypothetical protein